MDRHLSLPLLLIAAVASASGVACTGSRFAGRLLSSIGRPVAPPPQKIAQPVRPDARLAVGWVGHATTLVQMDDKLLVTDPVLTTSVGQVSTRLVAPGVDLEAIPKVDAIVVSHMHFDHLSLGTLAMLEPKVQRLYVPEGGLVYVTNFDFDALDLAPWETVDDGGMKVTAVPVQHVGWRYGADAAWMTSFSGYVVEYHGMTVFFGGDTGYEPALFKKIGARFPHIDLAMLPIAPMEPHAFMKHNHANPDEALAAFEDLGARRMVPMHFDTFVNSLDEPGDAPRALREAMTRRGLDDTRVTILPIGGQAVVIPKG